MPFTRIAIIGVGVMGEAVIASLIKSKIPPNAIVVNDIDSNRTNEVAKRYGVVTGTISNCDVIFIVVKPQDCQDTLRALNSQIQPSSLIVSFVAGKKLSFFEDFFVHQQRVIRVMPNTPILAGKGFCAFSVGRFATKKDSDWLKEILASSSVVTEIPERHQDTVTALSGSGPAYFYMMAEAMTLAAERLGLEKSVAQEASIRVLVGAAAMIEFSGKDPSTLRVNVTSPNGTTAAALSSFHASGLEEIVYKAMKAAMNRSRELSN